MVKTTGSAWLEDLVLGTCLRSGAWDSGFPATSHDTFGSSRRPKPLALAASVARVKTGNLGAGGEIAAKLRIGASEMPEIAVTARMTFLTDARGGRFLTNEATGRRGHSRPAFVRPERQGSRAGSFDGSDAPPGRKANLVSGTT
ncbi:MAG TPA: hypothetical protein VML55_22190 [Planctomycetaceae bacterium]|nr:hypothetical protein [Planctomycetaceae bacterium]